MFYFSWFCSVSGRPEFFYQVFEYSILFQWKQSKHYFVFVSHCWCKITAIYFIILFEMSLFRVIIHPFSLSHNFFFRTHFHGILSCFKIILDGKRKYIIRFISIIRRLQAFVTFTDCVCVYCTSIRPEKGVHFRFFLWLPI